MRLDRFKTTVWRKKEVRMAVWVMMKWFDDEME
jgi:hypothetical protein